MRLIVIAAALFAAGSAAAQVPPAPSPNAAVHDGASMEAFSRLCLQNGPSYDAAIAYAKEAKWTELASDMAMAFTPVGEPAGIEGWTLGDGDQQPFAALVVYRGKAGDKDIEGCSLASSQVDAPAFEKRFVEQIAARRIGEEVGEDTIYRRYSAKVGDREAAIAITLPRYPKGTDQVTISVVAATEVAN